MEPSEKLAAERREFEKNLEGRVKAVIASLRVPRREDLAELGRRMDVLAERIERLKARK